MDLKTEKLRLADIVGTWRLKTFDLQEGAEPLHAWGFDTHGLLIYTPSGHMSVAINRYAPWTSEGKPKEPAEVHSQNLFYAGSYVIEEGIIKHYVTQASDPDRIGTVLTRKGSLQDGLLTLTGEGPDFLATLVWKRLN